MVSHLRLLGHRLCLYLPRTQMVGPITAAQPNMKPLGTFKFMVDVIKHDSFYKKTTFVCATCRVLCKLNVLQQLSTTFATDKKYKGISNN